MDWLANNWIWLAFTAALVLMMRAGGCCGGRHGKDHQADAGTPAPSKAVELLTEPSADNKPGECKPAQARQP